MDKIRTWDELLDSGLTLKEGDITESRLRQHFAQIQHDADGLLRLQYGIKPLSLVHQMESGDKALVVQEAVFVYPEGARRLTEAYVPYDTMPGYRHARGLGLLGDQRETGVYNVLVSTKDLDKVEFTNSTDVLVPWERVLLEGCAELDF